MNMLRLCHMYVIENSSFLHYVEVLCQFSLCKAHHAYLTYLMLQRQLSHLTTVKFKPLIFSMYGLSSLPPYIASARTAYKIRTAIVPLLLHP
jgi:hypothetical protein